MPKGVYVRKPTVHFEPERPKIQVALRQNEIDILDELAYTPDEDLEQFMTRASVVRAFVRYCIIHKETVLPFLEDHKELRRL